MTNLIKITYNEADEPVVSGRELHEKLEVETPYKQWFDRMCEYGFEDNKDYCTFLCNRSDGLAGKPRTDHAITLDMAKQLCMIQRTDIGRKCREYFIEVEKAWNSEDMILGRALKISERRNKVLAEKNEQLEAKVESLESDNYKLTDTIDELDRQVVALTRDNKSLSDQLYKQRGENLRFYIQAAGFEKMMEKGTDISLTETAKELEVGRNKMVDMLIRKNYLYRAPSGRLIPHANRKTVGVFSMKEYTFKNGYRLEPTVYVTIAGRAKILAECIKDGLVKPMLPVPEHLSWELSEAKS